MNKFMKFLAVGLLTCLAAWALLAGCDNSTTSGVKQSGADGKTLVSIAVTTPPTKTEYELDEDLDLTGLVVTATYSDKSTAAVTGYTAGGYDKTVAGNQTVTVTYKGKTASFTVHVINPAIETVAAPTADPGAGPVPSGTTVTLATATEDAVIWYTTDGSVPAKDGEGSTMYESPFAITPPVTVKAIAVKDGMNGSAVLEAEYTLLSKPTAAAPTADPGAGPVPSGTIVTLATATEDAVIWYTTDGSAPAKDGEGSTMYESPFAVTPPVTVKAIAVKDGMNDSAVLEAEYTVFPSFIPPGSTITALTANTWADGNIPASGDAQWFRFTATASAQFIHAGFGTLADLYVQVYDSSGATVGSRSNLYYKTPSASATLTVGQEYYIRVWPYSSSGSGAYKIMFNTEFPPPGVTVTALTANTQADGNLPTSSDIQLFKFTATASRQFIHISPGTLSSVSFTVYNSSGAQVGSGDSFASLSVTEGQEYYIRVSSSGIGTYKIMFNAEFLPPGATALSANTWADGNISASADAQWFRFTATASPQFIHASFGTLADLYVQVYDSSGATVGSRSNLYYKTPSASATLTVGQEYYIRVWPYSSSGSGAYKIMFNTEFPPPGVTVTALAVNTQADGNLPTSSDIQLFKFTATANRQFIHISPDPLSSVSFTVYNSSGDQVGSGDSFASLSVTAEQEYYIRVWPYSSSGGGTYKIMFTTEFLPPGATATALAANTWADGNISASADAQWFKFDATASTQFIHASFGTLADLYIQVYDSAGAAVGSRSNLYSSTPSASWTLTVGQEYYIRVWPYSSSYSGTYKIAFNTSSTAP